MSVTPSTTTGVVSFAARRLLTVVLAVATLVAAAAIPASAAVSTKPACPSGQVPPEPFTDVTTGNVHRNDISCLLWWDITRGTTATTYSPAQDIKRGEMAAFLSRLLDRAGVSRSGVKMSGYSDVNGVFGPDIYFLTSYGVVGATSGSKFSPGSTLDRATMARWIMRTHELVFNRTAPSASAGFTDLGGVSTADRTYINKLSNLGVTTGWTATTYRPSYPVTRAQMASFVMRYASVAVSNDDITTPVLQTDDADIPFGTLCAALSNTSGGDTESMFGTLANVTKDSAYHRATGLDGCVWTSRVSGAPFDSMRLTAKVVPASKLATSGFYYRSTDPIAGHGREVADFSAPSNFVIYTKVVEANDYLEVGTRSGSTAIKLTWTRDDVPMYYDESPAYARMLSLVDDL